MAFLSQVRDVARWLGTGSITRKTLGNAVDIVGTRLHLPEVHASERLAGGNTVNTQNYQYAQGSNPYSRRTVSYVPNYTDSSQGQNRTWSKATDTTPTGNQPGGGQPGGGQPGGGQPGGGQPGGGNPSPDDLAGLRNAYGGLRSSLEAQAPIYEQDYKNTENTINNQITSAQNTAETQKTEAEKTFGDILRQNLQTYKDLEARRRGVYSGLGSLDSSSYMEENFRGDQALKENQLSIGMEKAKNIKSINDQLNTYVKSAQSEIARAALAYQQNKVALQQALAQNDLSSAQAIIAAQDTLSQRAQTAQNTINDFKGKMALLQAQGYDVIGNLKKINGNDFANMFIGNLNNTKNSAFARYVTPNNNIQGTGFIGPNGRRYASEDEYLRLVRQGQA